MPDKYRLILNPAADGSAAELCLPAIDGLLRSLSVEFDVVRTQRPWHASDLAQEAVRDGYQGVVAVGGDGTANEVLNGLMQADQQNLGKATLGILCAGRGNDFAYGLGLPADLSEGCRVLAGGRRRALDVGHVVGGLYPQGRYFGNGVGIGFDAVVGFEAAKLKRLHGFASYLVAALKTIFLYYKAPLVNIEHDGGSETMRTLMVSVMNGRRMGGGFMMAPEGAVDDGLFDVCVAEQVSRARVFGLIPKFMQGTQATQKAIRMNRTQQITVTAIEGTLPAHADGETLCIEGQQLTMTLLPARLEVYCL